MVLFLFTIFFFNIKADLSKHSKTSILVAGLTAISFIAIGFLFKTNSIPFIQDIVRLEIEVFKPKIQSIYDFYPRFYDNFAKIVKLEEFSEFYKSYRGLRVPISISKAEMDQYKYEYMQKKAELQKYLNVLSNEVTALGKVLYSSDFRIHFIVSGLILLVTMVGVVILIQNNSPFL